MTAIDIRPCGSIDEFVEAASIMSFYYRRTERDRAWAETWLKTFELERMLVARDGDGAIGAAMGAFGFDVAIPGGGTLPASGLTHGAALPSHRRRGLFGALMLRQLDAARERGEPLAYGIPASEPLLVRRGFGAATFSWSLRVPRERTRFRRPFEPLGRVRHVSAAEAAASFPAVYDRAMRARPGMLARSPAWWEHMVLADPEYRRGGGGTAVRALLEIDGAPVGYAIYRLMPAGAVRVLEAVAASGRADGSLWRYLLDIDHVDAVAGDLRVDHPLPLLLDEPRCAELRYGEDAWLRILDLEAAFAARGFGGDGAIVIEVADELLDRNAGRWRIEPGGAARTAAEPELALGIGDLASTFLGGVSFAQLRATGRLDERRAGAVKRADALFGDHPAPWCPQMF